MSIGNYNPANSYFRKDMRFPCEQITCEKSLFLHNNIAYVILTFVFLNFYSYILVIIFLSFSVSLYLDFSSLFNFIFTLLLFWSQFFLCLFIVFQYVCTCLWTYRIGDHCIFIVYVCMHLWVYEYPHVLCMYVCVCAHCGVYVYLASIILIFMRLHRSHFLSLRKKSPKTDVKMAYSSDL